MPASGVPKTANVFPKTVFEFVSANGFRFYVNFMALPKGVS